MMQIDIFTLFPEMFAGPMSESMVKRAQEMGALDLNLHNFRQYAEGRHRVTDEPPYGGGGGMVLKPEPIIRAVEDIVPDDAGIPVILLSPQGRRFDQQIALELAEKDRIALICGHYEGFDERIRQTVVTDELSIGDYVLTGGELAAMVIVDAVMRLIPGVLGSEGGAVRDSHATGLLEHPHYTRPAEFRGLTIPKVLTSGHSGKIAQWRREESLRRTWQRRPDLLLSVEMDKHDKRFLLKLAEERIAARIKHDVFTPAPILTITHKSVKNERDGEEAK